MAMLAMDQEAARVTHVRREQLLAKLKENREKHAATYAENVRGYKARVAEKLQQAYEKAKQQLDKAYSNQQAKLATLDLDDPDTYLRDSIELVPRVTVELPVPRNFTAAYDTAIAQTEWEARETVELTAAQFRCFVQDIWDWSADFIKVSKMYSRSDI